MRQLANGITSDIKVEVRPLSEVYFKFFQKISGNKYSVCFKVLCAVYLYDVIGEIDQYHIAAYRIMFQIDTAIHFAAHTYKYCDGINAAW